MFQARPAEKCPEQPGRDQLPNKLSNRSLPEGWEEGGAWWLEWGPARGKAQPRAGWGVTLAQAGGARGQRPDSGSSLSR